MFTRVQSRNILKKTVLMEASIERASAGERPYLELIVTIVRLILE